MDSKKKEGRYQRLFDQIADLTARRSNALSRMATVAAVLSNKMEYFFWTGFYLLEEGELYAGPYQGPPACQHLAREQGVCWAGILTAAPVVVPDVEQFPGHIACDSRSRSEIVVPLMNAIGEVIGVLDVDSTAQGAFDEIDALWLTRIVALVRPDDIPNLP
ncbi:MAG TPA: GAF domain-containing protein [Bacteroidales bacterium]|nr:GAF domain-containing protein [Bacteroidales bacterium]HRZ76603.1 GAF domain-containing protein [Bacteroidales bacterium]